MRGKTYAYPSSVKLSILAQKFDVGATKKMFKKHRDAFAFIIGSVYYKTLINKDEYDDIEAPDPDVRLSSKILAKLFGNNYNKYVDFLIQEQLIQKTSDHRAFLHTRICRGYALNPNWIKVGHKVKWHTLKNKQISVRLQEAFKKDIIPDLLAVEKGYKYVTRYLEDGGLKIDESAAIVKLNEVLKDDLKCELSGCYNKKITPSEKFTLNKSKVLNFNDSISEYTVDSSGYRLHTALVRLPKYLRKHVTYKGQHLINLDLKNSQPFLLCSLFNKKLWDSSATLCVQKLHPELYNLMCQLSTENRIKTLYWKVFKKDEIKELKKVVGNSSIMSIVDMLSKLLESNDNKRSQNINFKNLCESGTLYEAMGSLFSGKYIIDEVDQYGTRDMVKVQVMRLFFGGKKKASIGKSKELSAFIETFPEIGNLLLLLKSGGYKKCPCLLQRLESHLILKVIATELYRKNVSPVFTVHDSIAVLYNDADGAEKIMSDTIFNKIGLRPKIEREYWYH